MLNFLWKTYFVFFESQVYFRYYPFSFYIMNISQKLSATLLMLVFPFSSFSYYIHPDTGKEYSEWRCIEAVKVSQSGKTQWHIEIVGWSAIVKKQHTFDIFLDGDLTPNDERYQAPTDPLLGKINKIFWGESAKESRRFEFTSWWVSKKYNFWIQILGISIPQSYFQWEQIETNAENLKKAQDDFEYFYETMKHDISHPVRSNVVYEFTSDGSKEITVKLYPFLPSDIKIEQKKIGQCKDTQPEYSIAPNLILAGSAMTLSHIDITLEGKTYHPETKYASWKYTYIDSKTWTTKSVPAIFPYYEYSFSDKNLKKDTKYVLNITYQSRPEEGFWIYSLTPSLEYDPNALKK